MPYKIVKVKNGYSVRNSKSGKIYSKRTTRKKAVKQMKLLYMIESGKSKMIGSNL